MQSSDIFNKILIEIKKVAGNEDLILEQDTILEAIPDWDSLNNVDLEMALEETFKVSFEVGEFEELKTVSLMRQALENKLN